MHNLADGIFIGFGFPELWKDHGMVDHRRDRLSRNRARARRLFGTHGSLPGRSHAVSPLFMNFISRMSRYPRRSHQCWIWNNDFWHGLLLAFGAGIYLQIAAAECMPRVSVSATSNRFVLPAAS